MDLHSVFYAKGQLLPIIHDYPKVNRLLLKHWCRLLYTPLLTANERKEEGRCTRKQLYRDKERKKKKEQRVGLCDRISLFCASSVSSMVLSHRLPASTRKTQRIRAILQIPADRQTQEAMQQPALKVKMPKKHKIVRTSGRRRV